jgi:hypothetical protein
MIQVGKEEENSTAALFRPETKTQRFTNHAHGKLIGLIMLSPTRRTGLPGQTAGQPN